MKPFSKIHNDHRGFTMIEIVVVLIVLAIMAPFVITRVTTDTNNLITQTEILKSHLRYAQIMAMNDTVPWGIRVPNANSYILYKNNATANDILPGETPGVPPAPQTHTLPTDVTITSGVATYNFDDWGSPGTSTLTITLSQGTTTSSITITRNTGYVQ
jgi:MSHA pilin protein MshC